MAVCAAWCVWIPRGDVCVPVGEVYVCMGSVHICSCHDCVCPRLVVGREGSVSVLTLPG